MIKAKDTIDTKYGEKIRLESDFSDKSRIKSLPWEKTHRSWDGEYWTVDAEPHVLPYLEEIGTTNLGWLEERFGDVIDRKEEYYELSRAKASEFDPPSPDGVEYYPFQRAGIEYAVKKFDEDGQKGVLIADEMGLGKTIQALGVANHYEFDRVLVVCPASLKENWRREANEWLVKDLNVAIYGGGLPPMADVVIVNYALLSTRDGIVETLNEFDPELLVLDESHYIKNKKAKRTKAARSLESDKRIFLTGTPIKNRPIELWTQVNELTDEFDFWNFAKRYANAHKTRWGWDMDGASNLDELQERLRSEIMVRRRKKEVLKDLPDKIRQVIPLSRDGLGGLVEKEKKLREQYGEKIAEARRKVARAKVEDNDEAFQKALEELQDARQVAFEAMSTVRRQIAIRKADSVIEHVENVLESEDKVIVFAHHKQVIAKLEKAFGSIAVTLTGDTPQDARQRAVDRFQNDPEARVFIGSIHAAGTGLTLTASSHIVFAELDWTPSVNSQAEDRAHRIGQDDTVQIQYLVVDGSLEARIAKANARKQKNIDAAMDEEGDSAFYAGDDDINLVPSREDTVLDESVASSNGQEEKITETTDEEKEAIHRGLKKLARLCDGAQSLDNAGFNKLDTDFGKSLAAAETLSDRQAHYGKKLVRKYRRQLEDDLLEKAFEN